MNDSPSREVVVQKIYTAHVLVAASTDDEAEKKAYEMAMTGKLKDIFTDDCRYEVGKFIL